MRLLGRIWFVLVCAVLVLVACGTGEEPEVPGTSTTPVTTPPPPPTSPEMDIGEIVWALDVDPETGEPTDIVTRFTTESPGINAVIEASDVPEGTEFTAIWSLNDQPIAGTEMDITASEDLDHAWIAFSFTRDTDQRYPRGQLSVVITTSEGDLREDSVEIGFP